MFLVSLGLVLLAMVVVKVSVPCGTSVSGVGHVGGCI